MAKTSAGLLMFRVSSGALQVLLVHPGGPFWAKKDEGAWSIPKGELAAGEAPLTAARREFEEETGCRVQGPFIPLTPITERSRSRWHSGRSTLRNGGSSASWRRGRLWLDQPLGAVLVDQLHGALATLRQHLDVGGVGLAADQQPRSPLRRTELDVRPAVGTHQPQQHGFRVGLALPHVLGIFGEHGQAGSNSAAIIDDLEGAPPDHGLHIARGCRTGTRPDHLIREEPHVHGGEENEKSFGLHGRPLSAGGRPSRMPVRRGPLEPGSGPAHLEEPMESVYWGTGLRFGVEWDTPDPERIRAKSVFR